MAGNSLPQLRFDLPTPAAPILNVLTHGMTRLGAMNTFKLVFDPRAVCEKGVGVENQLSKEERQDGTGRRGIQLKAFPPLE